MATGVILLLLFFLPTKTMGLCSCLSSGVLFTYLWHSVCIHHCDHPAWVTWHTDWTICQSGGKPFVILYLYHAQFTSPSPTFKWIREEKEAHNAMFTDAACPQDSGTLTIFEKNRWIIVCIIISPGSNIVMFGGWGADSEEEKGVPIYKLQTFDIVANKPQDD